MSGISSSGKLVYLNQTDKGEAGGEMCFFHAVIYEGTELFVQFEKSGEAIRLRNDSFAAVVSHCAIHFRL
jgi:hypothetical protein